MKTNFITSALLGATAMSSSIESEVEGADVVLFTNSGIKWTVGVTGIFDRDTGFEFF